MFESTNGSIRPLSHCSNNIVKEFALSSGRKLSFVWDISRGVFAVVKDGEEAYEVQPCQLINLPQINSRSLLKKYLKNHFVVANSSSENTTFYRFHPRLKGGLFSKRGLFRRRCASYAIYYGQGPTIRQLEMNYALQRCFAFGGIG